MHTGHSGTVFALYLSTFLIFPVLNIYSRYETHECFHLPRLVSHTTVTTRVIHAESISYQHSYLCIMKLYNQIEVISILNKDVDNPDRVVTGKLDARYSTAVYSPIIRIKLTGCVQYRSRRSYTPVLSDAHSIELFSHKTVRPSAAYASCSSEVSFSKLRASRDRSHRLRL